MSVMMASPQTGILQRKLHRAKPMHRPVGLSYSSHRIPNLQADGSITQTVWPELVGKAESEAVRMLQQNRSLKVEVLHLNDTDDLTLEYNAQRVQLFVDDRGRVLHAPQVG
eukprot:scaffold3169_cov107-Cylindrotheca_fusiformis.AAC.2